MSVGVPRLYEQRDLRLSYVIWQEGVSPFVAVELLSPGTEKEDFGETTSLPGKPPTKWEVYEKILRIPYYIIFDRYTDQLRTFRFNAGCYEPLSLLDNRLWIPELKSGIGSWQGTYRGIQRIWLRWYDESGQWIKTDEERASTERRRAEAAEAELSALKDRLRAQGIDPDVL